MARVYLTTNQAAKLLSLSPCTLVDWRWRRIGPPWVQVSRGCVRYDQESLERWLQSRTVFEIPNST
ncbi:MAG: helix-turn-helix transcriptional regulator [Candidatus Micrarchaeota archaeon]